MILRAPSALAALVATALGACAGPRSTPAPDPSTPPLAAVTPAIRTLPAGTILRLLPTQLAVPGAAIDRGFVDALLHEALRLSVRFDIAADVEDCDATFEIAPTLDAAAGQIAVALRETGGVSQPLCAEPIAVGSIPDAVDRTALAVRRALGERVDVPPTSIAELYSSSSACVRATERVLVMQARGQDVATERLLAQARQADPGCALTQNAQAAWQLGAGHADAAARTAAQALRLFEGRLAPTTAHRLARTLLLARALLGDVPAADEQLQLLGAAFVSERPHDPHGRYTLGLAANYQGRFGDAVSALTPLRTRWPRIPWVDYHLTFARLGVGDAHGALETIDAAARRLPPMTTLLPSALALFGAGEHDELDEVLQRAARRAPDGTVLTHEVLRMQAAHAILTERRDLAVRALLEDLEWLRQRPTFLGERALDVAEAGEVLVRLGGGELLTTRLTALRNIPTLGPTVGLALVYVEGLSAAASDEFEIARVAASTLRRANSNAWAAALQAAIARARGDLSAEARELATAVRLDDSALLRAALARSLRALGRGEEAAALMAETRERMLTLRLRRSLQHPLLSPGRALAFLATEPTPR